MKELFSVKYISYIVRITCNTLDVLQVFTQSSSCTSLCVEMCCSSFWRRTCPQHCWWFCHGCLSGSVSPPYQLAPASASDFKSLSLKKKNICHNISRCNKLNLYSLLNPFVDRSDHCSYHDHTNDGCEDFTTQCQLLH